MIMPLERQVFRLTVSFEGLNPSSFNMEDKIIENAEERRASLASDSHFDRYGRRFKRDDDDDDENSPTANVIV